MKLMNIVQIQPDTYLHLKVNFLNNPRITEITEVLPKCLSIHL